MKKILFLTDFSKASLNAFIYALRLAKSLGTEVVTLHVYDSPLGTAFEDYDFIQQNYDIQEWGDFENFKSEVPKLRAIAEKEQLDSIKVTHMLERGDTIQEILRVISEEKPGFVVMGTKGATGLKEVFLGSIAERVMNQSHSFVLAVPASCTYRPLENILFLTQYGRMEMDLLNKVQDFAHGFNAEIHVVEVKPQYEQSDSLLLSKWEDKFRGSGINFAVLASNDVEGTVMDYIEVHDIALIAFSVRHKNFFQRLFMFSLARKMAFHATVPVLSIPV